MKGQASLMVVHYDRTDPNFKDFVTKAVESSRDHKKGQRFFTYVPLHGKRDVAYVWFPHESHSELHPENQVSALTEKHGEAAAVTLAHKAKKAVKGLGSELMHLVAEAGKVDGPKPYIMAYGIKVKSGQGDTFRSAAKHFMAANRDAKDPIRITVHRPSSGAVNTYLVLLGADDLAELDPDGKHNDPRLAKAVGPEKAAEIAAQLKDSTSFVWRQPMRYVAAYSNP
ncbi:hypothetical protein SAMN06265365_106128 [Tistlia consotensis]|uniref:Uncharacterized protein n=1 Tax=Tistlia consotensis USBA 355 TaxID=560819 RepID=A0A1Y6BHD3_9PROT|nr:hypothetical protein [Tistlia consotensis]SMF04060.1 hypothetical protein SAMN05428998_103179 [Tistlia consotensis USBA 355]SNR54217.1 hypothetical protein SAMN06265365_106128 [Tistlia consotensis]